jgi:hypothetical protein
LSRRSMTAAAAESPPYFKGNIIINDGAFASCGTLTSIMGAGFLTSDGHRQMSSRHLLS